MAKNPSYKTVKYQGVIRFAENTELWDAWEGIFTDLTNDRRQEDARAFFEANGRKCWKAPKCSGRRSSLITTSW